METHCFHQEKKAAEGRKDREEHSHAPSEGQVMVVVSCREPGAPELRQEDPATAPTAHPALSLGREPPELLSW